MSQKLIGLKTERVREFDMARGLATIIMAAVHTEFAIHNSAEMSTLLVVLCKEYHKQCTIFTPLVSSFSLSPHISASLKPQFLQKQMLKHLLLKELGL